MKRWVMAVMTVLVLVGLAGCETMKGFGRDMEKAGEAIEGAAKK